MTTVLAGHHRRSIRLRGYDYSQPGAYFVTIVAAGRKCIFEHVENGAVSLSKIGLIVQREWQRTPDIRREVELEAFVVMPNHLHGISVITSDARPGSNVAGSDHRRLQIGTDEADQHLAGYAAVWQRNYYEHVVRDEQDRDRIRRYIETNPWTWTDDDENPLRQGQTGMCGQYNLRGALGAAGNIECR